MTLEMFMNDEPVHQKKTKRCTLCKEMFPATLEYFHKGSFLEGACDGLRPSCKSCNNKRTKAHHDANRELIYARQVEYNKNNSELVSFQNKRGNAKKAGVEFTLGESGSSEEALWIDKMKSIKHCSDCNIEISWYQGMEKRNCNSGSFDRIDSNIGYVNGNVRLSCNKCNTQKGDLELDEWIAVLEVRVKKGIIKEVDPALVKYLIENKEEEN